MSILKEKISMYQDYCRELDRIANREPMTGKEASDTAVEYIDAYFAKWENIWADNENLAGFLITSKRPGCHPDADYMIAQLYIKPEYRRQGLAKKAVCRFIKGHPGIYCKLMVKNNTVAYAFWEDIRKEVSAKKVNLATIVGAVADGEEQIGFSVK